MIKELGGVGERRDGGREIEKRLEQRVGLESGGM